MEYVLYKKTYSKEQFKSLNIVISEDCEITEGVKIWQNVIINKGSKLNKGCEIFSNSVLSGTELKSNVVVRSSCLEDCVVGKNSKIGPFAHIRMNTFVGANCVVGNFVEIKNSKIGSGTKMAHLAYIGDAVIGKNCNIGCGVVFCNYNGKLKQKSVLGDNVFVGSNCNLIAPLKIGSGAYIAAGSTINLNVEKDEFSIARARQVNKQNFNISV